MISTLVSMLALGLVSAPPEPGPSATATLPLRELVPLYAPVTVAETPPPMKALVTRSRVKARLAEDALHVEAHFEVDVLASDVWTRVSLLGLGSDTYVVDAPSLADATIGAVDGELCLVTRKAGTYGFDVRLVVRATPDKAVRSAQLRLGEDALPAPMRVDMDSTAFALVDRPARGEALEIFPEAGAWRVRWQSAAPKQAAPAAVRPPLDPSISRAIASWVSTLEGRATLRVHYDLQLDREQPLAVTIPSGLKLERVFVNGVPIAAAVAAEETGASGDDGSRPLGLTIVAAPARLGENHGTVEVVLVQELGVFHLSGRLGLALPRVSWPIAELTAQTHLPAVFNYRREGGSMEQVASGAQEGSDGSSPSRLPGKVLAFRQSLIASSSPTLDLAYSVDISGSYFR